MLLSTWPLAGQGAEELWITVPDAEIVIERMPAAGCHLLIWLPSMYDEEGLEREFLSSISPAGIEVWWVDVVDAHFLPRSVRSYDEIPPEDVAAVIQAAVENSDRKIALMASGRGALTGLSGALLWHSENPGEEQLLGVLAMFPDVYAYPPEPGEMPVFHHALDDVPIPVRLLEPEYSPRYLWLDLTIEHLREAGADVEVRYLRQVRAGFHFEPEPTVREVEAMVAFPALLAEVLATMGPPAQCPQR